MPHPFQCFVHPKMSYPQLSMHCFQNQVMTGLLLVMSVAGSTNPLCNTPIFNARPSRIDHSPLTTGPKAETSSHASLHPVSNQLMTTWSSGSLRCSTAHATFESDSTAQQDASICISRVLSAVSCPVYPVSLSHCEQVALQMRLDNPSAFWWHSPFQCWMVNWNSCRCSIHRATCPSGSR